MAFSLLSNSCTGIRCHLWTLVVGVVTGSMATLALLVGTGYIIVDKPGKAAQIDSAANPPTPPIPLAISDTMGDKQQTPGRELGKINQQRLERLLSIAKIHEKVGRITKPPGSNAVEAYSLALEIDPGNQAASEGLARVQTR